MPGLPIASEVIGIRKWALRSQLSFGFGVISELLNLCLPMNQVRMEAVEGNIQEALSLTVRRHRCQAPPASHSLRVSARRQQSFKRLLGGALLPQLPPLLSARRVQRLGLYHQVNPW